MCACTDPYDSGQRALGGGLIALARVLLWAVPSAAGKVLVSALFSISPRKAIISSVNFGPQFALTSANPTLPKIADDHRCAARSLRRHV